MAPARRSRGSRASLRRQSCQNMSLTAGAGVAVAMIALTRLCCVDSFMMSAPAAYYKSVLQQSRKMSNPEGRTNVNRNSDDFQRSNIDSSGTLISSPRHVLTQSSSPVTTWTMQTPQSTSSPQEPILLSAWRSSSSSSSSRSTCGGNGRRSSKLYDHGNHERLGRAGQGGAGGGTGGGGGEGGGGGGKGSGGDDADGNESDGQQPQPELFLAASGLAGALEGLKSTFRNMRLPWSAKEQPSDEGSEAPEGSEERLREELAKVLVADVVVDDSVIPRDVLASAAVKSELLGREASAPRIKACADILNQWYQYEGHLLSSVSNAVVSANGTISFSVYEPVVSSVEPVSLLFYKPMNTSDPGSDLARMDKGKTRPGTIARGLGLKGGEHFKVDMERWRGVLQSGLFNGAQLAGAHQNAEDKGCTLDINVEERRTVVFEPGVTKTLFDSNWAGEVCFEEKNTLGRNTVLGLDLRRSMTSPFTSFSIRLGNNRFGQPGGWQVSFFRDTIAPQSGVGGNAGGGYADGAIGTASSAPVFSTASPRGTPRDLGILARSIRSAHHGNTAVDASLKSGNATNEVSASAGGGAGGGGATIGVLDMSRCHGVSLSSSWPFPFARATLGAGYQQVSPPANVLKQHDSHVASDDTNRGGSNSNADNGGAIDVLTLSGGLSKHWELPGVLQKFGRIGKREDVRRVPGLTSSSGNAASLVGAGAELQGSVSSFLDVKTGCLLEGSISPRPFTQEMATLVHRVPVGPSGKAGSWNVTLNVRQQFQHCSQDTPLHQVPPFGGQRTVRGYAEGELGRAKEYALSTAEVRVPLRDLLGRLSAQAVFFTDVGAFRPVTWTQRQSSSPASSFSSKGSRQGGGYRHGWDTARGPSGGGTEGFDLQPEEDAAPSESLGDESTELPAPADGVETQSRWRSLPSPPPVASPGGFRAQGGQGFGLRLADLIQVDVGISRAGLKQVHIGLVDRNF